MRTQDDNEAKFLDLVERVGACKKCPRMNGSARVLGPGCGPLDAPLMFLGEAPGRLGADGSHLPFHGDKSGHNFERLIEQVGISRYEVFVTNAVLCNPKDEQGNNATPTPDEIANCAPFLRETIEILDPSIVVTLGVVALKACGVLERHAVSLREHVRTRRSWMRRTLIPVYHPGQRAMVHRSFANQLSDYQFVAETLRRPRKPRKRPGSAKPRSEAAKLGVMAQRLLRGNPSGLSYFALHKLCFLAEIASLESTGERLTNAYVVRQKDGPYFVDLHLAKLAQLIPGVQSWPEGGKISLRLTTQLDFVNGENQPKLSSSEEAALAKVLAKYGRMSDEELKRVVYMNKYMRALLRKEKSAGANLYNAAVLPFVPHD
ncbi:MAG: uracil-DNA glycosylase family protein [Betaproteobacteria bacterium]|jgi:uracil-DNA glycosylase family 4